MDRKWLIAALLMIPVMLAGCSGNSTFKRGWVESSLPGRRTARFAYFDGTERASFSVQEGERIDLTLDLDIQGGNLSLRVIDPAGDIMWEETYRQAAQDSLSFQAQESGRCQLVLEAEDAKGSYNIQWSTNQG